MLWRNFYILLSLLLLSPLSPSWPWQWHFDQQWQAFNCRCEVKRCWSVAGRSDTGWQFCPLAVGCVTVRPDNFHHPYSVIYLLCATVWHWRNFFVLWHSNVHFVFTNCLNWTYITVVGLGSPLSGFLERVPYKFSKWMNDISEKLISNIPDHALRFKDQTQSRLAKQRRWCDWLAHVWFQWKTIQRHIDETSVLDRGWHNPINNSPCATRQRDLWLVRIDKAEKHRDLR